MLIKKISKINEIFLQLKMKKKKLHDSLMEQTNHPKLGTFHLRIFLVNNFVLFFFTLIINIDTVLHT